VCRKWALPQSSQLATHQLEAHALATGGCTIFSRTPRANIKHQPPMRRPAETDYVPSATIWTALRTALIEGAPHRSTIVHRSRGRSQTCVAPIPKDSLAHCRFAGPFVRCACWISDLHGSPARCRSSQTRQRRPQLVARPIASARLFPDFLSTTQARILISTSALTRFGAKECPSSAA
jgi:hypothetical protein